MKTFSRSTIRRATITCAATLAVVAGLRTVPARAGFDPVGVWTLSQDGTARQCRMQLRAEALNAGHALAMPSGCRHAFPVLDGVRSWVSVDDAHVTFDDAGDAAVLLFEDDGTGWRATGPDGTDIYTLTPSGKRTRTTTPAAAVVDATMVPAPEAPPAIAPRPAPVTTLTTAAVAGHYAVMRGSRDTGCMVTLDDPGKNAGSPAKARLAPACRDQGIMIFDPIGWQMKAGRLVLTARKGHTADLDRSESGLWVKSGASAQPLGLKRL